MDQGWSGLLVGVLALTGVAVTATVSYWVAKAKVRQDLEIEYDKDLRSRRITHYLELWKLLAPLARYPAPNSLAAQEVARLSVDLKTWYFDRGGLFLSGPTRNRYFALQDACRIVMLKDAGALPNTQEVKADAVWAALGWTPEWADSRPTLLALAAAAVIPGEDFLPGDVNATLRDLGSALRTSMAGDVLTRRETALLRDREPAGDGGAARPAAVRNTRAAGA